MTDWREHVPWELPPETTAELLELLDSVFRLAGERYQRDQANDDIFAAVEERLRLLERWSDRTTSALVEVWTVEAPPPFWLCLVMQRFSAPDKVDVYRTRLGFEIRLAALLRLPCAAGRALVRPRTAGDRLLALLWPRKRGIGLPELDVAYVIETKDRTRLAKAVSRAFFLELASRPELLVEINDDDLMIEWPSVLTGESVLEACEAFGELARALGAAGMPYR